MRSAQFGHFFLLAIVDHRRDAVPLSLAWPPLRPPDCRFCLSRAYRAFARIATSGSASLRNPERPNNRSRIAYVDLTNVSTGSSDPLS